MRRLLLLPLAALLLAACGDSKPSAQFNNGTPAKTTTVTATTAAVAAVKPGYLNPQTLEQTLLAKYNVTPPLSAHAVRAVCVIDYTADHAACTMYLRDGRRAVEPVAIASDGSSYTAGMGQ